MYRRYRLDSLIIIALAVVLLQGPTSFAEAPQYEPVVPKLFKARDGLGNVLAKLERGEEVRIAYLGGSITAARGWRVTSREWFAQRFPKATVSEIHAAIGGTGILVRSPSSCASHTVKIREERIRERTHRSSASLPDRPSFRCDPR